MEPNEYEVMRSVEDIHWWYRGLRFLLLNALARHAGAATGAKLLDAGCGTGANYEAIRRFFPQIKPVGMDISPLALQYSAARVPGFFLQASVECLPFPEDTFEFIVSMDVLYHERVDPALALRDFFRVLKPGGALLLNLPAFSWLSGEHDRAVHAGRRFHPDRLADSLREAGFQVETMTCWNSLLLLPIWLWRRLDAWSNHDKPHSDLTPDNSWVNQILAWWIRIEVRLALKFGLPLGVSVFTVARKMPT
ncbi:MAG: class I SAM-dependent methyltransferase [Methylacidiphilales bacterium]|nr:class I SAM-dependent methyltransferase [Candidatus Methylacidiphilales bacterium]